MQMLSDFIISENNIFAFTLQIHYNNNEVKPLSEHWMLNQLCMILNLQMNNRCQSTQITVPSFIHSKQHLLLGDHWWHY